MSNNFAYDRLITNARNNLPGALEATLKLEVFNATHDFCAGSTVWQDVQTLRTKANKVDYEVTASDQNAYYTQILYGYRQEQDPDTLEWRKSIDIGVVMNSPTNIKLLYTPNSVENLVVVFAMAPVPTDELGDLPGIPESFWSMYHNVIMEGVLGRMMSQAAKPYSNERLGIYHLRKFRTAIATAKVEKDNGNVRGGQGWIYPQNFA